MLNSLTRLEADRTERVLGSLSTTFRADRFAQGGAKIPTPLQGAERLELTIADILSDEIPIEETLLTRRGTELFVLLPDGEIFLPGDSALRGDRSALLDRLTTAVSDAPAGLRHELNIEIGHRTVRDGDLAFPVRRSGTLARAFVARGARGSVVSAGLIGNAAHRVRLVFRVAADDQP